MSSLFNQLAFIKLENGKSSLFLDLMKSPDGNEVTRSFPGNILFEVTQDDQDENSIIINEKWDSKVSWENYMKFRANSSFVNELSSFLAAPPEFKIVTAID
jgi:quinol monooxygenase YgiN